MGDADGRDPGGEHQEHDADDGHGPPDRPRGRRRLLRRCGLGCRPRCHHRPGEPPQEQVKADGEDRQVNSRACHNGDVGADLRGDPPGEGESAEQEEPHDPQSDADLAVIPRRPDRGEDNSDYRGREAGGNQHSADTAGRAVGHAFIADVVHGVPRFRRAFVASMRADLISEMGFRTTEPSVIRTNRPSPKTSGS